jgi:hypothetical protein
VTYPGSSWISESLFSILVFLIMSGEIMTGSLVWFRSQGRS